MRTRRHCKKRKKRRKMLSLRRFLIHILYGEGGEMMMAMLWAQKIVFGKKTFKDVPKLLKAQVKEILEESGLPELAVEEGN